MKLEPFFEDIAQRAFAGIKARRFHRDAALAEVAETLTAHNENCIGTPENRCMTPNICERVCELIREQLPTEENAYDYYKPHPLREIAAAVTYAALWSGWRWTSIYQAVDVWKTRQHFAVGDGQLVNGALKQDEGYDRLVSILLAATDGPKTVIDDDIFVSPFPSLELKPEFANAKPFTRRDIDEAFAQISTEKPQ